MSEPTNALAVIKPGDQYKNLSLSEAKELAGAMVGAKMFPDLVSANTAYIKILAGQEMGVPPFQAMSGIHIIKGRATLASNLLAAKVLESGRYRYRVLNLDADGCILLFEEKEGTKWVPLGKSEFTVEDAKAAGTQNMDKFGRNMMFARALSNGYKWYCPDALNGVTVYVEGEVADDEPNTPKTEAEEQAELDAAAARLNRRKTAAKAGQKGLKVAETTTEPETSETAPSEPTEPTAAEPETQPEPETASEPENHESKPEPTTPPKSAETEKPAAQVEGKPETYMEPVAPPATPAAEESEFASPSEDDQPHTTEQRADILKYMDDLEFTTESEKKAVFTGLTGLSTFKELTRGKANSLLFDLSTGDAAAMRAKYIDNKEPASGA